MDSQNNTPQPVQEPLPSSLPVQATVSHNKRYFFISIGVLFLILVIGIGYVASLSKHRSQKMIQAVIPSVVPTKKDIVVATVAPKPITEDSATVGWKTYTSKKYPFSFKYPADWDYFEFPNTPSVMVAPVSVLTLQLKDAMKSGTDGGKYETIVFSKDTFPIPSEEYESTTDHTVTSRNTIVNGLSAIEYTTTYHIDLPGIENGDVFIDTKMSFKGSNYTIELLQPQYQDIYSKILSTVTYQ